MLTWSDFTLPPINLLTYPKQNKSNHKMSIVEETTVRPQWVLKDSNADDGQVDGTHYKDMGIEPWDVMQSILTRKEFLGFLKGNIIKYAMRQGKKDGANKDAEKARHYAAKLKAVEEQW